MVEILLFLVGNALVIADTDVSEVSLEARNVTVTESFGSKFDLV